MIAYNGSSELKARMLDLAREHREADRLVKGTYWRDGKGCAVGCTLESAQEMGLIPRHAGHDFHSLYEVFGVPRVLARLEDALFESLPDELSQAWPERFLRAIQPGADLTMVAPRFLHNLLSDPTGAVQRQVVTYPKIGPSVQAVIGLYARWIDGSQPTTTEWAGAAQAAGAAEWAAGAAGAAERIRQANTLIRLLEEA